MDLNAARPELPNKVGEVVEAIECMLSEFPLTVPGPLPETSPGPNFEGVHRLSGELIACRSFVSAFALRCVRQRYDVGYHGTVRRISQGP